MDKTETITGAGREIDTKRETDMEVGSVAKTTMGIETGNVAMINNDRQYD